MNQLLTEFPGKMPVFLDDIRFIDSIYRSAINAVCQGITGSEPCVISGCEIVFNAFHIIEPGFVYFKNEIFTVEQQILPEYTDLRSYKFNILEEDTSERVFANGVPHKVHRLRTANVVTITSFPDADDLTFHGNQLTNRLSSKYELSFIKKTAFNKDFGNEADEISAGNHTHDYEPAIVKASAFNKEFATEEQVLSGEPNVVLSPPNLSQHGNWVEITNFNEYWSSQATLMGKKLSIRKLNNAFLHIYGNVLSNNSVSDKIFVIPEIFRPITEGYFPIVNLNGSANKLYINADSEVELLDHDSTAIIFINIIVPIN